MLEVGQVDGLFGSVWLKMAVIATGSVVTRLGQQSSAQF